MRDNPLHARAFGSDPMRRERRLARFFSGLASLIQRRGTLLGACDGRVLVGALGITPPGVCRPTLLDLLRLLPSLLGSNAPANVPGVLRWRKSSTRQVTKSRDWRAGGRISPAFGKQ